MNTGSKHNQQYLLHPTRMLTINSYYPRVTWFLASQLNTPQIPIPIHISLVMHNTSLVTTAVFCLGPSSTSPSGSSDRFYPLPSPQFCARVPSWGLSFRTAGSGTSRFFLLKEQRAVTAGPATAPQPGPRFPPHPQLPFCFFSDLSPSFTGVPETLSSEDIPQKHGRGWQLAPSEEKGAQPLPPPSAPSPQPVGTPAQHRPQAAAEPGTPRRLGGAGQTLHLHSGHPQGFFFLKLGGMPPT